LLNTANDSYSFLKPFLRLVLVFTAIDENIVLPRVSVQVTVKHNFSFGAQSLHHRLGVPNRRKWIFQDRFVIPIQVATSKWASADRQKRKGLDGPLKPVCLESYLLGGLRSLKLSFTRVADLDIKQLNGS